MENIVLPYVGEIIIIRETKQKAKVKKVTYIDNNTERSVNYHEAKDFVASRKLKA